MPSSTAALANCSGLEIRKTCQLKARVILEGEGVVLAALSCSDNQDFVDFLRAHSDRSSVCVTTRTARPTP